MKFLIPLLICIPLAFLNCERNRVSTPPVQQHIPPTQQIPGIPTPAPPTQESASSCSYLSRPIIFGDASCSRMFCYTPGWCAGHGTVFMFCEAYRDLNDTTKSYLSFSGYLCYGGNRPITPWHSSTFMEPMQ